MFGLDESIAHLTGAAPFLVVLLVAGLLGLRHATDPDHLAAVTALVLHGERRARGAARLGAWWGAGHAVTLLAFGIPILVAERYLPERVQQGAESVVAALIVFLAVRLLVRWRHDRLAIARPVDHEHASPAAAHVHRPAASLHAAHPEAGFGGPSATDHRHPVRTPFAAFGVGLVHGMGGSAGVGVLLLAAIPSQTVAVAALLVLALFTAVSMTIVTTGIGSLLTRGSTTSTVAAAVPVMGVASLAFGLWYAAAAWELAPYPF
jgi:high-affinity nickel permease